MTSVLESAPPSPALTSEIINYVGEIANDANFKEFEIQVEEQSFTGDNYCGNIIRIKIVPLKNDQKTIHLIMKSAPITPVTRKLLPVTDFYKCEVFMYEHILPALYALQEENNIGAKDRFTFAKLFKGITEEYKEIVLMQDLADNGFVLHDKWTPMSFEHAAIAMQNLARFHATSFVLKEKDPAKFSLLTKNLPRTQNYGEKKEENSTNPIENVIPNIDLVNRSKIEEFGKDFAQTFWNCLDASLTDPYNVICHGDCWNNNLLFKTENGKVVDVVLIDWQIVRFASPATDIAYMLCLSMDEKILDLHFNDFLDLYYSTLQKAITSMGCDPSSCYPEEVFRENIKDKMVFGLMMALFALPFTLTEASEAKNVDDALGDTGNRAKVGVRARKRMNSIVNYFVNHNMI